jgi:hypothetical protein
MMLAYLALAAVGAVAVRTMPAIEARQQARIDAHPGGTWLPLIPGLFVRWAILAWWGWCALVQLARHAKAGESR